MVKRLAVDIAKLKAESNNLQADGLTYEVIKVGQIHHKDCLTLSKPFIHSGA